MKTELRFEEMEIQKGALGEKSSVPDLLGDLIFQNDLEFELEEDDEIYEGYGRYYTSYPYRRFNCYSRKLETGTVKTAVLENDFLKAVFLPEYGGRLWILWDKEKNRNLLYTNDVLRFSNLAFRNAWFSGGVEWNIGVIGHTPFTTAPLFTARLEKEDGTPVLRMYEYERIRKVTYQMDFWLGEQERFLNARMRIVNSTENVVPMYWWSNIAVPEHEDGRIIVPAKKAYTFWDGKVQKVDIPIVEGIDITAYKNIPASVDYFFAIDKEDPKYIVNVDKEGYGLFQMSTSRLQSRKLFTWGKKRGGDRWQEFLTDKAGRYLEIQAGLGKTQYGCIPMAPHTAWEWMERYGSIQLESQDTEADFQTLQKRITDMILEKNLWNEMEDELAATKTLAKEKGVLVQTGSGYGALENTIRSIRGKRLLPSNLDFGDCPQEQKLWEKFLATGELENPDPKKKPPVFVNDEIFFERLKAGIEKQYRENWYAHYQLGILLFQKQEYYEAVDEFKRSLDICENAWAYQAIASAYTILGQREEASDTIKNGMHLQNQDLSYLKDGFRILYLQEQYEDTIEIYESLGGSLKEVGRLKYYYAYALMKTGGHQQAYKILSQGLIIDDLREGEISISELWKEVYKGVYGTEGELPYMYDYSAT